MKASLDLYHYYEKSVGPFVNLSDLPMDKAEQILSEIRTNAVTFAAKRQPDYLQTRKELEQKARNLFIEKGGKPQRRVPHYMTLGHCPWLLSWYVQGEMLKLPFDGFDSEIISFTYGDLFPTMRFDDGKEYRGKVFTKDEIFQIINAYGLPQEWNPEGNWGPERYIEAQVWADEPLSEFLPVIKS